MNSEGALPTKVLVVDDERALAAVIAAYPLRGHLAALTKGLLA